jgi:hypothetical protein
MTIAKARVPSKQATSKKLPPKELPLEKRAIATATTVDMEGGSFAVT